LTLKVIFLLLNS